MQKMSGGGGSRRDRSRSPHVLGYRRGDKSQKKDNMNNSMNSTNTSMNHQMSNPAMNSMMSNPLMFQQAWNTSGNMNNMPPNNMASIAGGNMNNSGMATQNMMPSNMSTSNVDPPLPPMPPMPAMPANMPGMSNMMMPGPMMGMGGMDMMNNSGSMDMNMLQQQQMMNMGNGNNGMDMNMMGSMMMDPSTMGMGNMNNMGNMTNMSNMANMGNMSNMPNMQNMSNMSNMQNMNMFPGGQPPLPDEMPPKQEIVFKNCKLIPPSPDFSSPPMRPRPLGCRTIFVGGLPEKIRESMVRDIFERYGRIHTLRLSKKNFCHIRFDRETSVDEAMTISGYKIKVIDKDDKEKSHDDDDDNPATTGVLHVDFALSRDDQNEYERRQRLALRIQQQHMEELEHQMNASKPDVVMLDDSRHSSSRRRRRSPSPSVIPFSNAAIVQLMEKIKSEEFFASAVPTLLGWLERGECSKKTANQFYSMIQTTNSHIRRLFNDKMAAEEELMDCKERVKQKIEGVINLLEQVGKVLSASSHKRVWDHFTKPQRKNIETWQKMTQEFSALKEEFHEKFENEDGEMNYMNAKPLDTEEVSNLKRLNDSLQFQLEAYKNEVAVIKSESKAELEKFKAQFIARQALTGHSMPPLPDKPQEKPPPPPPLPDDLDAKVHLKKEVEAGCGEAPLIGTMCAFLVIHPQGASLDYVVSYIRALFPHVSQATVHHVLQKHKDVFTLSTTGCGANIENRWRFIGFNDLKLKD